MLIILTGVLAGICLAALVIGSVATLVISGQTRYRNGPEVGKQIISNQIDADTGTVGAEKSFFVGKAAAVERNATISFADLKQQLAASNCLGLIPALLVVVGFVGLLFFGALTVLVASPNLIGIAVMLIVLYVLARMLIDFIRA